MPGRVGSEEQTVCGRYVSVSGPEQLAESLAVDEIRTPGLGARYNVAPTMEVYAVVERNGSRRLGTLRWGLVPPWAPQLRGAPAPINARVETMQQRSTFAPAFARRRCLVPADGFYEWQVNPSGKQPYYIHDPEQRPLAFAGLWGVWRDPTAGPEAEPLFSCAIVTRPATDAMADLHDRMPLILPPSLWDAWLTAGPEEAPHLRATTAAASPPRLSAYPVHGRVNNVRNDGPGLLEPAPS